MNLWLSSAGRRVELLHSFRDAAKNLGLPIHITVLDYTNDAPTRFFSDRFLQVPKLNDETYSGRIQELIALHKPDLILPLIDSELRFWANQQSLGTVCISSTKVVELSLDKLAFSSWLDEQELTHVPCSALESTPAFPFPLLIKPRFGSNSDGIIKIAHAEALYGLQKELHSAYIQSPFVEGQEYTVDAYVSRDKKVFGVVPRKRLKVRGGEVILSETERNPLIIETVTSLLQKLEGVAGPVCVQGFWSEGQFLVTELNARFGGGVPLSIQSGMRYPEMILREWMGEMLRDEDWSTWQDGLRMSRFEQSVFY